MPTSGGTAGGINSSDVAAQSIGSLLVSYAGSALAKFGLGTVGTGKMAARGAAAEQIKLAGIDYRNQLLQQKVAQAQTEFAETNPFEPGFQVTAIENAPEKLGKMRAKAISKLQQLGGKQQTKKVIAKQNKVLAKIGRVENKLAPYTDVRIAELSGPNSGYWRERGAPPPLWLTQRAH